MTLGAEQPDGTTPATTAEEEFHPPGGWRRIAWTYVWNYGIEHEYPHATEVTAAMRRGLRTRLAGMGASPPRAKAVTEWAVGAYLEDRQDEWEHRGEPKSPNPLRPRPYLLVPELPPAMRYKIGRRGQYRPLIQFSKDWAVQPLDRDEMMADPPPPDTEHGIAVSIAAVVHALCELDEHTPPDWIYRYRSEELMNPWGISDVIQPIITDATPPACRYHRVVFDYYFIEGPLWISLPASVVRIPEDALSR